MGFMDRLKETASTVKDKASTFAEEQQLSEKMDKAKELANKATEATKTGIEQTKTTINEKREKSKQSKLPQEGGLIRYEVTYIGGHPNFQLGKKKSPFILLDITKLFHWILSRESLLMRKCY